MNTKASTVPAVMPMTAYSMTASELQISTILLYFSDSSYILLVLSSLVCRYKCMIWEGVDSLWPDLD